MRTLTEQTCPMRDGVLLRYNRYAPDADGAYPLLLMRTPYGKEKIHAEKLYANIPLFTDAGYTVAVMDLRGTGTSDGDFKVNTENEFEDGYDSVEWLAAQPWCDGSVGMFGLSYFGFTQLAAASMAPPSLRAICPFMTLAMEPFGAHMGSHTVNDLHLDWIYAQLTEHAERFLPDPAFRARVLPTLQEMRAHLAECKNELPANQNRAALIPDVPMLADYLALLNGIEEKSFWDSIRHPTDFSRMHLGIFHCTGWFDVAKDTTIRNYDAARAQADAYTRENSVLLIGPWEHGGALRHVQDGYDFGAANSGEGQQVDRLMLRWFDAYLKNKPGAADELPRVRYFVMGSNDWRTASVWPPEDSQETPLYLHGGSGLSFQPCEDERGGTSYDYDPKNPTPAFFTDSKGRAMLPDLAEWSASREDVIAFATETLDAPLTVAGCVTARLYASTDAKDTDFVARLVDVFPDGAELELASGLVRAKYRNGMWTRDFPPRNQAVAYDFEVGNTANTFLPGHRIKLYVCSALYPLYDRNLNTGAPACQTAETVAAHQTVWHSAAYPSLIRMPVLGGAHGCKR